MHDVDDRLNRDVIIDYLFNDNYTLDPQTQSQTQPVAIPTATVTTTSGPNSKVVVVWDSKTSNRNSVYNNTNRILQFNEWYDGISEWEPHHPYPYLKTYVNLLNKRKAKRHDIEFDEDMGLHLPSARQSLQANMASQQQQQQQLNNPNLASSALRQVNNPVSNRLFMKELNKLASNNQQPKRQSSANLKRSTSTVIRDDYLKDTAPFTDDMIVVNMKKQDLFDLSQLQLRSDDLDRTKILGNNNPSDLAQAVQSTTSNATQSSNNRNQQPHHNRLNRLHYQLVHQQSDPTSITGYDLEDSSLIQIQKLVPANGTAASSSNSGGGAKKNLFSNFSFEETINEAYSDVMMGELNGTNIKVYKKPPINALQVSSLNTSANSANSQHQVQPSKGGYRFSPAGSSTANNLNIIVTEATPSTSNSNSSSKYVSPQNFAEAPADTNQFTSQSSMCSNPSNKSNHHHHHHHHNRNNGGQPKNNYNFLTIHNKHQMQQNQLQQLAVSVTPAGIHQPPKASSINSLMAGNGGMNSNIDLTSLPPIISGKRINLPLGQHRYL